MCAHSTLASAFSALCFTLVMLLSACGPAKLLERDRPEAAFEKALKKLERDPKRSAELIAVVAESYAQLQSGDQYVLAEAKLDARDSYGERTVATLIDLADRRARVEALRRRSKRVVRVEAWDSEPDYASELVIAKRTAARRLLAGAETKLAVAQSGDRFSARQGVELLQRRKRYTSVDDAASLEADLRDLGTLRVVAQVDGDARGAEGLLQRSLQNSLRTEWVTTAGRGEQSEAWADMYAILDVPLVRPLTVQETIETHEYSREITTLRECGVDTAGRVRYDTLRQTVLATVTTSCRTFEQRVEAMVLLTDRGGVPLREYSRSGRASTTRTRVDIRGDRRALEGVTVPSGKTGTVGVRESSELVQGALHNLARTLGKIDADGLLGERLLASTE